MLDAGMEDGPDRLTRVALEEGERIVGVQSRVLKDRPASHIDLQFVIAKP